MIGVAIAVAVTKHINLRLYLIKSMALPVFFPDNLQHSTSP
jgi:hypothetical protein